MSEITKLERFLGNLDRLNYDAGRAIARLSEIDDLDKAASGAQQELDRVNGELSEAQTRLSRLRSEIDQANSTREGLNAEIAKSSVELITIRAQLEAASHRLEFVDAVLLLFSNIERIPPSLLMELAATLQMIISARFNPAAIYPIDYEGTREKAVELLELTLGKSLVSREIFDEVMKRLGEQHDDLMLDRLGKIERERAKLLELEAKLDQNILENGIAAAIFIESKGLVMKYICPGCKILIAHSALNTSYKLTFCPFCKAILQLRLERLPQQL